MFVGQVVSFSNWSLNHNFEVVGSKRYGVLIGFTDFGTVNVQVGNYIYNIRKTELKIVEDSKIIHGTLLKGSGNNV